MSNQNTTVGLIRLPHVAAALTDAGIRVATGDDFHSSARAIVRAAKEANEAGGGRKVVIVLADIAESGQMPWLEKTLRNADAVIVKVDVAAVATDPASARSIGGNTGDVPRLEAPTSIAEVLQAVGLTCPPELANARIARDGTVSDGEPVDNRPTVAALPSWPAAQQSQGADPFASSTDPATMPATDSGWDAPPAPRRPPLTASQPVPSAPQRTATVTAPVAPAPAPAEEDWGIEEPSQWAQPAAEAYQAPFAAPAPAAQEVGFQPAATQASTGAPVVLVGAGKGGVSKTTTALTLAQRAARLGHMRVVLIDGNRGQGDTRTFMRLTRATLPTVYDVATGADPASVVITPDRLAANRPQGIDRLEFALVMAPPSGLQDPGVVTSDIYRRVLEHARSVADLVVVDTQIQEGADTSGLFDDVWIPSLSTHAWFIGISDLSTPGVNNLHERLRDFIDAGVPTSRIAVMLNRISRGVTFEEQRTAELFSRFGRWLGIVHSDDAINAQTNNGELPWDHFEMAHVLDQVLFQVTGDTAFAPKPLSDPADTARGRAESGRMFGFLRRKGN